jgi:hypothetical protein
VVTLPLSGDLDQARLHPIAPTKAAKDHPAIVAPASSAPHTINAGTVGTFLTNFPLSYWDARPLTVRLHSIRATDPSTPKPNDALTTKKTSELPHGLHRARKAPPK